MIEHRQPSRALGDRRGEERNRQGNAAHYTDHISAAGFIKFRHLGQSPPRPGLILRDLIAQVEIFLPVNIRIIKGECLPAEQYLLAAAHIAHERFIAPLEKRMNDPEKAHGGDSRDDPLPQDVGSAQKGQLRQDFCRKIDRNIRDDGRNNGGKRHDGKELRANLVQFPQAALMNG